MRRRKAILAWVLATLAGAVVVPAWGQVGSIRVTVVDASTRPVVGARVTLRHSAGYVEPIALASDAAGIATFSVLRPGSGYSVEVEVAGFATVRVTDLRVKIDEVTRVPVHLLARIVDTVIVRARRGAVEMEDSTTNTRFDEDFLGDLPIKGRFYQNVLSMAPGVQDADGDGNPNVHGARFRDFRAEVSGVSNQDPLTGEWMSYINPDTIEEVKVITAGAGAEFGRAQGGFASVIQKQGSNDVEGVTRLLWRSSLMDGDASVSTPGVEAPQYDWLQPSFQVSGPLARDKAWFRLSHEYIRQENPINFQQRVTVSTRTQSINSDQLTWQATPRDRLALQFQYDPLKVDNWGVSAQVPEESAQVLETGGPQLTLSWTKQKSSRLLVDSLVSYHWTGLKITPNRSTAKNNCVQNIYWFWFDEPALDFLNTAYCFNTMENRVSGSGYLVWEDRRRRFTAKSQATWYAGRFLGMSHQLRFGGIVENEGYDRTMERKPDIVYSVVQVPGVKNGNTAIQQTALLQIRLGIPRDSTSDASGTNWALFLEDQIKPLPNLSVIIGLRYDRETIDSQGVTPFDPAREAVDFLRTVAKLPVGEQSAAAQRVFTGYEHAEDFRRIFARSIGLDLETAAIIAGPMAGQSQFWSKFRRADNVHLINGNFSPRLSIAWDPESNGKTKLALTAGRYHDKIFLAVPVAELDPGTASFVVTASRIIGEPHFILRRFPVGMNLAPNVQVVDRNLKTPYQDELTVSFERELWPETALKLSWIHRRFEDQLQDVDLNHYPFDYGRCVTPTKHNLRTLDTSVRDGKIDDCSGGFGVLIDDTSWPSDNILYGRPDGYPDLYSYNPGWGSIFQIGNSNTARYDAVVLEFVRRQYRNWQMDASYTYSEAKGDAEDFNSWLGDDRTTFDAERGWLSYDQRHVVKLNATVVTPGGFRLGAAASWQSGLPYSVMVARTSVDAVAPQYEGLGVSTPTVRFQYPTRRRNDHRNRSWWNVDVKVDKSFAFRRGATMDFSLEVYNLFDEKRYVIYSPFGGYGAEVNGQNDAYVTTGRQFQLGMRVAF